MIWIILLGGMVQGAFAQNLEIKGMVRDARNKEILEFANVVLQTMDSSLSLIHIFFQGIETTCHLEHPCDGYGVIGSAVDDTVAVDRCSIA